MSDDVTIEVRAGEVVGLLGPNGAGKTTTFYMIVGLTRPNAGAVFLDGRDVTRACRCTSARARGISYLPQEPSVFRKLTVEENILAILETLATHRRRSASERLTSAARRAGDRAPARRTKPTRCPAASAGGSRSRARSSSRAAFMLLDEPFAGIDPIAVVDIQGIVDQLRERGIGVLITDHNVRETLGNLRPRVHPERRRGARGGQPRHEIAASQQGARDLPRREVPL